MSLGTPDWQRSIDPNLPSARFWTDDFEGSVLQWDIELGGTGSAVALDTVRARSGIQSALLTGGSDGIRQAGILREFPVPALGLIGVECWWQYTSNPEAVDLRLDMRGTGESPHFWLHYDVANQLLRRLNTAGGLTTFASSINLEGLATLFHTFKLVVNPASGEYVRAIVDHVEYDLSGISGQLTGADDRNELAIRVVVTSDAGDNDTIRVDDVIFTLNEQ